MSQVPDFPYMPDMVLDNRNESRCTTRDPEVSLLSQHVDTEVKLVDSSAPRTFLQFMMRESTLSKRLKLGRITNGDVAFYANRKKRNLGTLDLTRAKYIKINRDGGVPYISSAAVLCECARGKFRW